MERALTARKHPDWIKAYLEHTKMSEAPSKFHYWTAVATIAGALERKVWIDQGFFEWLPNFYIIFVSPPGIVSKSTTASIGMSLLSRLPSVRFGPQSLTWQALTKSMSDNVRSIELPGDVVMPMSAVTIAASELGSLIDMKDRAMIDVLVDLWDGKKGAWQRATKTAGEDKILNPFINIIGCTTPAWISDNFGKYTLGGGFTSRTIFVYACEKRRLEAYPGSVVGSGFQERISDLVHDLERINTLCGEYKLTEEAMVWGREWYEKVYAQYRNIDPYDSGATSFVARKQTHLHKLGMVIAAARRDKLVIEAEDLHHADLAIQSVEMDLPEVFGRIAERDEVKDAVDLISILAVMKKVPRQALFKRVFNRMTHEQFDKALSSAVQAGHVEVRNDSGAIVVVFKGETRAPVQ